MALQKVIKRGRNVHNMMFLQCNTCPMGLYLTMQYQGEFGHIEGHAYSILFVHNVAFGPRVYVHMSLIIASPQKISFQNSKKNLNNMHADTLGPGGMAFVSSREVVLYKN